MTQWKWWTGSLGRHRESTIPLIFKFMYQCFHFHICAYTYFVCMWVCGFGGTHTRTCVHMSSLRLMLHIVLHCPIPFPARQDTQSNPELLNKASLARWLALVVPCLCLCRLEWQAGSRIHLAFAWVLGPDCAPHFYSATALTANIFQLGLGTITRVKASLFKNLKTWNLAVEKQRRNHSALWI